jgi:DNA/RNA endonuclease G (NUC1)
VVRSKKNKAVAPWRRWGGFGSGVVLGLAVGLGLVLMPGSTLTARLSALPLEIDIPAPVVGALVRHMQRHGPDWLQQIADWALEPGTRRPTSTPASMPLPPTWSGPAPAQPARSSDHFAACRDQFPAQQPLSLEHLDRQWSARALCANTFAVLYSGRTKTPLLVVERLNRKRLQRAQDQERTDEFYADLRLPKTQRAELSDYRGSGFDRGHLAAAANQPTPAAMHDSFALSNMVPQDPTHNRQPWAKLEGDIRKYALRASGDVFVYTGALYEGPPLTIGPNGVHVPSHLFKLVYDATTQRAWAYVLPNSADAQLGRPLDYPSFVQRTRWPVLAGLPVR